MAYTSQALVQAQVGRNLTSSEITMLGLLIPAVKLWIDQKTGSTFDTGTQSTRLYRGGTKFIDIEPCTNITQIQYVDDYGTLQYTYQAFEWVALPLNSTVKNQIQLRGYNEFSDDTRFPFGEARIQVTALFSEYNGTNVPEDIQLAATRMCASLISSNSLPDGVLREELEGHMIMYDMNSAANTDPMVMSILANRREIFIDDAD